MASETTWTWLRAFNYHGTTATIVLPLAREFQLRQFLEEFPDHQKWVRSVGQDWDGSKLSPDEINALKAQPFKRF